MYFAGIYRQYGLVGCDMIDWSPWALLTCMTIVVVTTNPGKETP